MKKARNVQKTTVTAPLSHTKSPISTKIKPFIFVKKRKTLIAVNKPYNYSLIKFSDVLENYMTRAHSQSLMT